MRRSADAQIDAIKQQLQNLREIVSPKVQEIFKSQKTALEGFIDSQKLELETAAAIVKEKETTIQNLRADEQARQRRIAQLETERNDLASKMDELQRTVIQFETTETPKQAQLDDLVRSSAILVNSIAVHAPWYKEITFKSPFGYTQSSEILLRDLNTLIHGAKPSEADPKSESDDDKSATSQRRPPQTVRLQAAKLAEV